MFLCFPRAPTTLAAALGRKRPAAKPQFRQPLAIRFIEAIGIRAAVVAHACM